MAVAPEEQQEGHPEEDSGPARTPFDNPYFLPVVVWGFALWFLRDAWIVPLEGHERFNRYGFGFLLCWALYLTAELRGRSPRVPYVWAVLMLGYAGWLAYLGWLAPEGHWYNDHPGAVFFDRWGSGFFAAWGVGSALHHWLRSRRPPVSSPTASAPPP